MRVLIAFMIGVGLVIAAAVPVAAEPTDITIRVLSRDAKFVGTSMGGVQITLRDVLTDELLAEGVTAGGTGNTGRIMKSDWVRGVSLSDESAARFDATLDLDEPRLIEVVAYGPLAQRQSANRVSATQWVVPGKHLTGGDGWRLEMPGFVVDVLDPPAHLKLGGGPQTIDLVANVTMMCGCPVEPGGLWDGDGYEVVALLRRNGEAAGEAVLDYGGETSRFVARLVLDQPGSWEVTVYAHDPLTGNTGVDKTTVVLSNQ